MTTPEIDLLLLILGFIFGIATRFKTPIMVAIFLIKITKWWIETHPHAKEIKDNQDIHNQINKFLGLEKPDQTICKQDQTGELTSNSL